VQYLPLYLLSLPVVLMALSIHEAAHGYAAYKLGDPTARNLGRITLNPVKHLDVLGFLAMLVFHVGWAKPVPINTRYFKNPRRDMAITGAAGPLSNLCLAIIHLLILRVSMIFVADRFAGDVIAYATSYVTGSSYTGSLAFTLVSLVLYLLYLGVMLNVILTVFNLIPIPPFDGSRIFYAFLPPKLYFGVMKYERYIMIGFIVLFLVMTYTGMNPLREVENLAIDGLLFITGLNSKNTDSIVLTNMLVYVQELLSFR
jgi:Zn-dependent protease